MKRSSGTLALICFALCLPVHAQDIANSSPSAAQPASVAATSSVRQLVSSEHHGICCALSQVRGTVNIDRHIGRGYEEAFTNVPITGGTKLHTDVGLAEVEFEDNSTLRLTPDSEVEFTLLKRAATGSTISSIKVVRGMRCVSPSLANTKGNTFTIAAGETSLQLNPSESHPPALSTRRIRTSRCSMAQSSLQRRLSVNQSAQTQGLSRLPTLIGYKRQPNR